MDDDDVSFRGRHRTCGRTRRLTRWRRRTFNILLVCRQIYTEAALVPFKTNTFAFVGPVPLETFLLRLNARQRMALTNILLYSVSGRWSWRKDKTWPSTLAKLFPGACHLTLYIELPWYDLLSNNGVDTAEKRRRVIGSLEVLAKRKLASVDVHVTDRITGVKLQGFDKANAAAADVKLASPARLDEWEAEIKAMLLPAGAETKTDTGGPSQAKATTASAAAD